MYLFDMQKMSDFKKLQEYFYNKIYTKEERAYYLLRSQFILDVLLRKYSYISKKYHINLLFVIVYQITIKFYSDFCILNSVIASNLSINIDAFNKLEIMVLNIIYRESLF